MQIICVNVQKSLQKSSFKGFFFKKKISRFLYDFLKAHRQGGQALKLVVWEVNHIDNTSYPFKGCLEVTQNEKAISKLASG